MNFQINENWKKILLIIGIVVVIEFFGYGFFAYLFRLIKSVS
tara:strand:- start:682 stop:807 length:126 start_codon:yes stop_codon:yes gene_type:complete